jgi:hypothetical protein
MALSGCFQFEDDFPAPLVCHAVRGTPTHAIPLAVFAETAEPAIVEQRATFAVRVNLFSGDSQPRWVDTGVLGAT